ncbi:MAG: serine hydrolase domain-containing protein [Vicinamibacterales bacterium]
MPMSVAATPPRAVRGLVLVVLLVGAAALAGAQTSPADRVARDPEVLGAQRLFTAWLEGQMLSRHLPGIAVGVVADQDLVWARGFGFADTAARVAMTPQTKFRMASHSKLFTATAVMQLREQGKLGLDDPVTRHLPWFRVVAADPDDRPITIEELLTHGSGLPREAGSHWTDFDFPTTDELRGLLPDRHAPFSPDVRWKYSNLAYAVAGLVIEAVSGQSWADYVQQHIYAPLGMTSSSVDRDVPGLAVGYGRRMPDGSRATNPFIDARGMGAATGITSTVEDMARFASAQFRRGPSGGGRILSTGSLRDMHRVRVLEDNWTQGNAIGFAVRRDRDTVYVQHGGSYPGYQTQTVLQLDGKVAVIVLTNADDSNPGAIATQLMRTVGAAVAKASAPQGDDAASAWDPSWSRFAGLYRGRGGESHVVELHRRLVVINPSGPNLDSPVQLVPIGNGQFRYTAPTGGGPVGEVVRFVEEGGRVVRMITGDSYVERVQ